MSILYNDNEYSDTEVILKTDGNEFRATMNWDANISQILTALLGLMVSATFSEERILEILKVLRDNNVIE